ncbi:DNA (cytosine-5-)-methyltransferase [Hellea sp.]|nr:DNA (cytosine-5-)-methyltransferase [Hellea sp.]
MRALDFYSGIGGWSLGLKAAGIDVVASYEWWQEAAITHHMNIDGTAMVSNIRTLDISKLPNDIDIVVGSPPCTQFSYANRGGSGDLSDGLVDIKKFLDVVKHLKPKFWAMENVPRTAKILKAEINGGELSQYKSLFENAHIEIFNSEEFGLPQRRKRCIVGNFNLTQLNEYSNRIPEVNLRKVIKSLSNKKVADPNFAISISSNRLSEHQKESFFSDEEVRINRSVKTHHPVYNDMKFPDDLKRSSRTVTATCTRVSRESIVIEDPIQKGKYRRLSVRERACLQGFPITYQFYGKSNSSKLKMVGNAIPPVLTYYLAQSFLGTQPEKLKLHQDLTFEYLSNVSPGPTTQPDSKGKMFPRGRTFRFAIPGLRFKSGMRFELNNLREDKSFACAFYFGDSKHIQSLEPTSESISLLKNVLFSEAEEAQINIEKVLDDQIGKISQKLLQSTWIRQTSDMHPFSVLDQLSTAFHGVLDTLPEKNTVNFEAGIELILSGFKNPNGVAKMRKYAKEVCLGMLVTGYYNKLNFQGSTPIKIKGTGGKTLPCRKIS